MSSPALVVAITKMDLVEYYRRISPVLLPHLKDRPHALHRHPNGAGYPGFFQKNVVRGVPDWVTTVTVQAESTGRNVRYFVCTDEASLLQMVNMGCIEINPWFSRVGSLERPDFLVFDLDPLETDFAAVVEVALGLKEILDRAEIQGIQDLVIVARADVHGAGWEILVNAEPAARSTRPAATSARATICIPTPCSRSSQRPAS